MLLVYTQFLATIFAASVIQSVSGFGFAIFFMSIAPFILPSSAFAVTVSAMLAFSCSISNVVRMRKVVSLRRIALPLGVCLTTSALMITLFAGRSDALLRKMLAVVLIVLSVYFIFFSSKIHIRPTKVNGVITGMLSGTLSGLFSVGGPPIVLYLLSTSRDNKEYFADTQLFFMCTAALGTIVRALNGMVTVEVVPFWAIGTAAAVLGSVVGGRLSSLINPVYFKRVVYAVMAVSGVIMLV
jgi:uncharacterized membrane protein YfcA